MKKWMFFTVFLAAIGIISTTYCVITARSNDPHLKLLALETGNTLNPDTADNNSDVKPTAPVSVDSSAVVANPTAALKPAASNNSAGNSSFGTPKPTETNMNSVPISKTQNHKKQLHHRTKFRIVLNKVSINEFLTLNDSFWSSIPLNIGLWFLFFTVSILLYLLKLKYLRQPLLFLGIIFFGFYLGGITDPINAIFDLLAQKSLILNLILILLPVIVSLVWGRFYCGWLCPLGGIQEFLNLEPETRVIPQTLDRVLKSLKYIILIVLGYLSWHTAINHWSNYNLVKTLFNFNGPLLPLILLGVILILSLMISRPFCKYLCPFGAILSLTSKLAPFRMRADAKKCMVCGKCISGECPMDAISSFNPEIDLPSINNSECIKCSRCQKNCRNTALRVTGFHIDHSGYQKEHSETDRL